MSLQKEIKNIVRDVSTDKETRLTLRVLLGEFGRVNDGKPITDNQCISVIKKYIKNIDESLEYFKKVSMISMTVKSKSAFEKLINEKELLLTFLPKPATINQMKESIDKIMKENFFKNKMQAMKPVIEDIESQGLDVDKKALSELIKNW